MPITISGNGGISGLGNIDGHDLETATLVVSGDTTLGPQAVGRSTLFVDESANVVGINTTTPAAAVFLEVADATDPIVSLNNEGNGEVRIGCTDAQGYLRTNSSHPLVLQTNATDALVIDVSQNIGAGTTTPNARIESQGDNSSTTQFNGFQGLRIHNTNGSAFGVTADINLSAGTTTNNRGAAIGVEYDSGTSGNSLYFATNPNAVTSNDTLVERLRIDPAGNVGINKSASLGAKLHIQDDSATDTTQIKLRNYKASVNTKVSLMFECSTSSSQGGNAVIKGICGTDALGSNAQNDGGLEFQTSSGGGGTFGTVMLLSSPGNVHIGNSVGTVHGSRLLQIGSTSRTNTFLEIRTNTTGDSGLLFSDTTTNDTGGYRGTVEYHHRAVDTDEYMNFKVNGADRVKIYGNNTSGTQFTGRVFLNGTAGGFDYNNTAHTLEYLVNGNTHSELNQSAYVPAGGAKNLGGHTARWALLFTDGIRFNGDNSAATTLDDYEEGTFIPNWDSTGATFTYDASYHQGVYTKIGNTCYFHFYMGITAPPGGTTSNDLYISGLPETIANIPNAIPSFSLGSNINIAVPGGLVANVLSMRITGLQNQTRIQLSWNLENGGQVSLKASDLTTSSYISISGFYQCA